MAGISGISDVRKPYDERDAQIVKDAHQQFKFGARMFEIILDKMYNAEIPHSRIHMYLLTHALQFEIQRNRSSANGPGMNVTIACLQNTSISMKMSGHA